MDDRGRVVRVAWTAGALLLLAAGCVPAAGAQGFKSAPATDLSAQASPLRSGPAAGAVDASAQASPAIGAVGVGAARTRALDLRPGTVLRVRLERAIDSGRLKNGEDVRAVLAAPVRTADGEMLREGTPVEINVVETLAAGVLAAEGEFSLAVERVGRAPVVTETETFRGRAGHRDVADAAPELGTDAGLPVGAVLTFHAQGAPSAAEGAPEESALTPGGVDGVAVGGPPPEGTTANSGEPRFGGGFAAGGHRPVSNARIVAPAENTFGPAQHRGQVTGAPNQIAPQTNGPQTGTGASTQPHA